MGSMLFRENGAYNFLGQPQGKGRSRRSCGQKRRIKKYEGKPKKPLTSFMLFLKDFRKTLASSSNCQSKTSPHEINKLAGKQWHLLPENLKLQYKNEAANALAKWHEENFMSQPATVKKEVTMEEQIKDPTSEPLSSEFPPKQTNESKRLTEGSSSSSGESSSGESSGSDTDCSY